MDGKASTFIAKSPEMDAKNCYIDLFRCPACKGKLRGEGVGSALICDGCAARWPIQDGIPCFLSETGLPDYWLTADSAELIHVARTQGWLAALDRHLAQDEAGREHVREYVASETQADFRFLMCLQANATILDVGSGWGSVSVACARNSHLVFALSTMLASLQFVRIRAQQEGLNNVVPVLGDATYLPLPPRSCDGVLMAGALEWVPWGRDDGTPQELQAKALAEAFQVLRPGGQLYVGLENRFSFRGLLGAPEPHTGLRSISLLPRVLGKFSPKQAGKRPFWEWTYSRKGLVRLLALAGFTGIDFYYPIPSHQNFRYITDYSAPWISRFLISRFKGHGRFSEGLRIAGFLASLLRIERWLSPCFSVLARKPDA